jgi:long-chain fatty acid transport protein
MDSIRTAKGEIISEQGTWNRNGIRQPTCTVQPPDGSPRRPAMGEELNRCGTDTAVNVYPNAEFGNPLKSFVFGIPPEVRLGVRYHQPRSKARTVFGTEGEVRDPLHDDVFDIEVNGSYTMNSAVDKIEVRLTPNTLVRPAGVSLPENADRPTGYKDSYGLRLGGQWNVIQDKLGLRAGGWYESQSQDPAYLQIGAMGYERWGFGGGVVFRQDFIDLSLGYQRLQSAGLDNGGNGAFRAAAATGTPDNRTAHAVNGGKLTQSAHAFTFGATLRF